MKFRRLLILALTLVAVLLAVWRISNRVPSSEYPERARVAAIFIKGGCLD